MQVQTPGHSDFSFHINGNCVITYGVEVDTLDGFETCKYGTNSTQAFIITQLIARISRYYSAHDVFGGLNSLLGMQHSSELFWMLLAAGFALQKEDFGLAPFPQWGLLAKWLEATEHCLY